MTMTICSFIEIAEIRELAKIRRAVESTSFDKSEQASSLRLQTLAGFLCIKKALVAAMDAKEPPVGLKEKDVIVGHNAAGAPILVSIPETIRNQFKKICVSVSHTRDYACGYIVFEEKARNVP
jgi:phosphopantetheinyl transferase (holo-ACP synthase)